MSENLHSIFIGNLLPPAKLRKKTIDSRWYAEPLIGLDLIGLVLIGLDLICLVLIGYQYW